MVHYCAVFVMTVIFAAFARIEEIYKSDEDSVVALELDELMFDER